MGFYGYPSSSLASSLTHTLLPCLPLTDTAEETNNCSPTTGPLDCEISARFGFIPLDSDSSQSSQKQKLSLSSQSPPAFCMVEVKCDFLSIGERKFEKTLERPQSFLNCLFAHQCKAALGTLSLSGWETYGLNFYCDHIWVSEWWRMRNSGCKGSKIFRKYFRLCRQHLTASLHPSLGTAWLGDRSAQCPPCPLKLISPRRYVFLFCWKWNKGIEFLGKQSLMQDSTFQKPPDRR